MQDGLPEGWTSDNGVVTPAGMVAAYAARAQLVKGTCREKGCFRRVEIDARHLCGRGLARLSMRQIQELYRCHRLDERCSLQWHNEPAGNPLRLGALVGKPNIRVRVRCQGGGCKYFRVVRVEEMIAGLVKRKQGDEKTEIDGLPKMMTSGCPLCRRTNWAVDVLYVNTQTAGWKQLGERTFDSTTRTGGI